MLTTGMIKSTKTQISTIIDTLVNILTNPDTINVNYQHQKSERKNYILFLYIYKLIIYNNEIIEKKYNKYINRFKNKTTIDTSKITNINIKDELELLLYIKEKLTKNIYYYNEQEDKIIFQDEEYIATNWLITIISLILEKKKTNEKNSNITIYYAIPNKEIKKIICEQELEEFLKEFTFYTIEIKQSNETITTKDNGIQVVKNAAINYLKHLKQYKHGLETNESYQIFYNLLKNECQRQGFILEEKEENLLEAKEIINNIYEEYIDEEFYEYPLSKQTHIIENIVWKSSNDKTLLNYIDNNINECINLITNLRNKELITLNRIKKENEIKELSILLILVINKFLLNFNYYIDEIDYSLFDVSIIKPKYMSSICSIEEREIKTKIKSLKTDLEKEKKQLEKLKKERQLITKETPNYQNELERCVSNINRSSILVARINSSLVPLTKRYDEIKKEQEEKCKNANIYEYNQSIIRHICNSIIGCNFYIKTNIKTNLLENVIIFEDYERTDNSFYLEIKFKELLSVCNPSLVNGDIDQFDLPKIKE